MTIHDTQKIKQRPVTAEMTPAQIKNYKREVREEQHGNTGTVDYRDAWNGRSYSTPVQPLSDFVPPKFNTHPSQEVSSMTQTSQFKTELIQKWKNSIEKMKEQITKLQNDKSLSVAERQKKIARRIDIINDYEFSIKQAQEYIDRERRKAQALFNTQTQTK